MSADGRAHPASFLLKIPKFANAATFGMGQHRLRQMQTADPLCIAGLAGKMEDH